MSREDSVGHAVSRLRLWLGREGVRMIRVSYDSEDVRREVLANLAPRFAIHDYVLSRDAPGHETSLWMVEQLSIAARAQPPAVVSFRGFDDAFRADPRDALTALNFQRESFKEAGASQIWWLSRNLTGLMVRGAPDLDSWFDDKLYLTGDEPAQPDR